MYFNHTEYFEDIPDNFKFYDIDTYNTNFIKMYLDRFKKLPDIGFF